MNAARAVIDKAEYLCLFGIGVLLNECYEKLVLSIGREPDFLSDNAREKWGMNFFGKKCIPPEEIERLGDKTTVIITIRKYETIYEQLRNMGVQDIILAGFDSGYYSLHDLLPLDDVAVRASKQVQDSVNLEDKWTLVTGASRGVGRQIAIAMAKLGSNIIAHCRSSSHIKDLADECSASGVKVVPIAAELSNLAELDQMFLKLEQLVPQVDIVFNNAAISPESQVNFWTLTGDVFLDCYAVNLIAPIRICQRLIPPMIERGYGRVINLNTHIQKKPDEMAYACSKAALDKFVYDFSPKLHNTGVAITLIDPGWVRTDTGGEEAPNTLESVIPGVLLGAVLEGDISGRRFSAQDYAGLSLEEAVQKAKMHLNRCGTRRWV